LAFAIKKLEDVMITSSFALRSFFLMKNEDEKNRMYLEDAGKIKHPEHGLG
jgi:hypothetical protein